MKAERAITTVELERQWDTIIYLARRHLQYSVYHATRFANQPDHEKILPSPTRSCRPLFTYKRHFPRPTPPPKKLSLARGISNGSTITISRIIKQI